MTDKKSRIIIGFKRYHGAVGQSRYTLEGCVLSEQIVIFDASQIQTIIDQGEQVLSRLDDFSDIHPVTGY